MAPTAARVTRIHTASSGVTIAVLDIDGTNHAYVVRLPEELPKLTDALSNHVPLNVIVSAGAITIVWDP
jgi:hypothetical protein